MCYASALPVFTGPDCKSTCRGAGGHPWCKLGLGLEQSHRLVMGSEELGKHRAVIRSVGLDSKHCKERKITEGRAEGGGVMDRSHHFVGHLHPR